MFFGENIRLIYDVLFESKKQNIPGLSIDFEKAFDTVCWKFISKVLDYFNFGRSIKTWISLFQNGAELCILQNGFMSDFLDIFFFFKNPSFKIAMSAWAGGRWAWSQVNLLVNLFSKLYVTFIL